MADNNDDIPLDLAKQIGNSPKAQPIQTQVQVQQQPTQDAPKVEPVQQTQQAAATEQPKVEVFDFDKTFKEKAGFDWSEFENVKNEAQLAKKYKEQVDANPYANEHIAAIDSLVRKGVDPKVAYEHVYTDIKSLDAREKAIRLDMLEKPGLKREVIENQVDKKYGLGKYAPIDDTTGEPNPSEGLQQLEYETAGEGGIESRLMAKRNELVQPKQTRSQVIEKQTQEELKGTWEKNVYPNFKKEFENFEMKFDGIDAPLKLKMDGVDEVLGKLTEDIVRMGAGATDANIAEAKRLATNELIVRNQKRIVQQAINAALGKNGIETHDTLHNPSVNVPAPANMQSQPDEVSVYKLAMKKTFGK